MSALERVLPMDGAFRRPEQKRHQQAEGYVNLDLTEQTERLQNRPLPTKAIFQNQLKYGEIQHQLKAPFQAVQKRMASEK